jgi:uncharacterized repeat protein (TIGR04076 family)
MIPIRNSKSLTDAQYKKLWKNLGPIEIKMVEKNEKCRHNLGDTFYYEHPYSPPKEVKCHALLHVLELYIWRVALGFPSWESDDRTVHRIHCPAKKGTVWEVRKITKTASRRQK